MSIKKILTTVPMAAVLGISGLAMAAPAANAASDWDRLAECESNGNWSIDTGNGYYGGLQFSQQSWEAVGGTGNPAHASKSEQIQRAGQLQAIQGWNAWPSCSSQLGLTGSASTPAPAPEPAPQAPVEETSSITYEEVQQSTGSNDYTAPAETAPAPAPVVEESAPAAPAPAPAPAVDVPASDGVETHVVKSGDTLQEIAELYGVDGGYNTLFQWNDNITDPNLIFVGQEITVS